MSTPLANVLAYLAADVTLAAIHGGRVSENRSPQRDAFRAERVKNVRGGWYPYGGRFG